MTDLAERLREIERNPSPDLWEAIASRTVATPPGERRGLRHRLAAGLVAAVVSIAAFVFLFSVFRPDDSARGPTVFIGASEITLLVSSKGPSGDLALLTGTLTTRSGCVAVGTTYVVWPAGYSLADEDGAAWLIDDEGNRVAAIGDEVQMGGGITNLAHAEPSVPGGIPSGCEVGGPDAYWFAGVPEAVESSASPSGGPDGSNSVTVQVPDLTGLTIQSAEDVLASVGLDAAPIYLASDSDAAGVVMDTEPGAGTTVDGTTSVIVDVSAGPDGGGFGWAGSIVKGNPGVFLGDYRGRNSVPVLAVGPGADLGHWRATLEAASEGRAFELVRCPVEPSPLREAMRDLTVLFNTGQIEGGASFGVDARTCSVLLEGSFSAESIRSLRDRFGDLVTIVDGIKPARTLEAPSPALSP